MNAKAVVVTGAALGFGAETAQLFKQAGAIVIGLERIQPLASPLTELPAADIWRLLDRQIIFLLKY